MIQPGRKYSAGAGYRYGFNGKENDNDVKGEGNQQDYGMRIYDPRLGKFLSVDPLAPFYPWYSPYQFAGNSPIGNIDLDGAEPKPSKDKIGTQEGETTTTSETKYQPYGYGGVGGANSYNASKKWYWHNGGLKIGQKVNEKTKVLEPVLSESGWYSGDDYLNLLEKTEIAKQLSNEAGYGGYIGLIEVNAKESLEKFIGQGLSQNAAIFLDEAARRIGQDARFYRSGYTETSSFNIESFIGLGQLITGGLKLIASYAAKNIVRKGLNYIRTIYLVKKTQNVGTLGGEINGAGFYTIGLSGESSTAGTVGVPVLRRFTTVEVGGYDRLFDSEVKLLEDFAAKFHNTPNVRGTLTLTSERQFCGSCTGVIEQFKKMFPNITLHTINGVK